MKERNTNYDMPHMPMEELLPIVGKLAGRYTAGTSTSIAYEKAQQLMEAVLYCIREAECADRSVYYEAGYSGQDTGVSETQFSINAAAAGKTKPSAYQVYEVGLACVEKKVKAALALYNKMQLHFDSYGNRCLYDTFVKGMPEFFKWYDIRFAPQDTILTLDYPVGRDLTAYTGIDRIYEYLVCIKQEQEFLGTFPRDYVIDILKEYNPFYEDMIDNICEAVSASVCKKP